MELIFLGTGAGMPSSRRNVTSMALRFPERQNKFWLFDCGEATQHQIMKTNLRLSKLEKIFLTHLHGDHLFGLPGLLSSRGHHGVKSPLQLYGPKGVKRFIECVFDTSGSHIDYELEIIELDQECLPGATAPLFEDQLHRVYCAQLDHRIDCFGYRVEEKDKPGKLDERKLAEAGIQSGPIYGRLKHGETVRLEDGTLVDGKQFVGPSLPGRVVAIMGDTKYCANAARLAKQADLLVHEATFDSSLGDLASRYQHSTSIEAAETAVRAQASALILTHISSRYQEDEAAKLLNEAREVFKNTYMAEDLWSFSIHQIIPVLNN